MRILILIVLFSCIGLVGLAATAQNGPGDTKLCAPVEQWLDALQTNLSPGKVDGVIVVNAHAVINMVKYCWRDRATDMCSAAYQGLGEYGGRGRHITLEQVMRTVLAARAGQLFECW